LAIGKPNPRGKKLDKQPGSGPRFGSPLVYVLLLLVGFLLLRSFSRTRIPAGCRISRLLDASRSDGCQKVVLSNDWVKCYPRGIDGSKADSALVRGGASRATTPLIKTLQDSTSSTRPSPRAA